MRAKARTREGYASSLSQRDGAREVLQTLATAARESGAAEAQRLLALKLEELERDIDYFERMRANELEEEGARKGGRDDRDPRAGALSPT